MRNSRKLVTLPWKRVRMDNYIFQVSSPADSGTRTPASGRRLRGRPSWRTAWPARCGRRRCGRGRDQPPRPGSGAPAAIPAGWRGAAAPNSPPPATNTSTSSRRSSSCPHWKQTLLEHPNIAKLIWPTILWGGIPINKPYVKYWNLRLFVQMILTCK